VYDHLLNAGDIGRQCVADLWAWTLRSWLHGFPQNHQNREADGLLDKGHLSGTDRLPDGENRCPINVEPLERGWCLLGRVSEAVRLGPFDQMNGYGAGVTENNAMIPTPQIKQVREFKLLNYYDNASTISPTIVFIG
jgi:hypothetical protein